MTETIAPPTAAPAVPLQGTATEADPSRPSTLQSSRATRVLGVVEEEHLMTDKHPPRTPAERRLDEEYLAEHGTTLSREALEDEAHPEIDPDSPAELARKVRAEAAEGEGVREKAKRALHEIDRDVSGEYERRDDPEAPPPGPTKG